MHSACQETEDKIRTLMSKCRRFVRDRLSRCIKKRQRGCLSFHLTVFYICPRCLDQRDARHLQHSDSISQPLNTFHAARLGELVVLVPPTDRGDERRAELKVAGRQERP